MRPTAAAAAPVRDEVAARVAALDHALAGDVAEDGEAMLGSVLIIDAADAKAAKAFADGDPFAKAGLFESVRITRWRKAFFNPAVGA